MTHICGMRGFGSSCPDLESRACQGCIHFSSQATVAPLNFSFRGGKDSRPCLQQPLELMWVGLCCSGAGQFRGRRAQALLCTAGRGGSAKPRWSSIPSVLREGSCPLTPREPMPAGSVAPDTDEINRESQWSFGMLSDEPHPEKKLPLSELSLLLAPVGEASFFALRVRNVNKRTTGLQFICWFSVFPYIGNIGMQIPG